MKRRSVWVVERWRNRFGWECSPVARQNDSRRWAVFEMKNLQGLYPGTKFRVVRYDASKTEGA
jgi:hypothetical protein